MATKKTNNSSEYQKSMAIYSEIAKYASAVFNKYAIIIPDEGLGALTAREVQYHTGKNNIKWDDSIEGWEETRTFEAPGIKCTATPSTIIGICMEFESHLKIKSADKVRMMKEYTCEASDIVAVCKLPAEAKIMAKATDDSGLRPTMEGMYIDCEEKYAVTSEGHIVMARPIECRVCKGPENVGYIIPRRFVEAHAGEEVVIAADGKYKDTQYAYCGKDRARIIEGRYPNWKGVLPKEEDGVKLQVGKVWNELRDAIVSLGASDEENNGKRPLQRVLVCGKKGESELHLLQMHWMAGTQEKHVALSEPLPIDFGLMLNAKYIALIANADVFTPIGYYSGTTFNNGKEINLVMPMCYGLSEMDHNTGEYVFTRMDKAVCEELERRGINLEWKVKAKKAQKKQETPADVKPETPETVETPETTETPAEPVTVNPEPKVIAIGTEVCVKGDESGTVYVIEMLSEQRAILKGVSDPTKRRVEKRENLYVAGTEEPATVSEERVAVSEEPVSSSEAVTPSDSDNSENSEQSDNSVKLGAVYVCSYSEKAVLVFGDTKKYRKQLKKYGTWIAKYEGWCLSKKRMDYVKRVVCDKLQETTTLPEAKVSTKKAA